MTPTLHITRSESPCLDVIHFLEKLSPVAGSVQLSAFTFSASPSDLLDLMEKNLIELVPAGCGNVRFLFLGRPIIAV